MRHGRNGQRSWLVLVLLLAGIGLGAGGSDAPIAEAVKNRDQVSVATLLKQHADVNVPMADGTTALHWAAQWGDLETARQLIGAGANTNAANRYGATPLWVACTTSSAGMVTMLLEAGANPNATALQGEPPLVTASRVGSVDTVKALLVHGAEVNAEETFRGQTALTAAVGSYHPHPEVAQILLDRGADVNVRSTAGHTALWFAARQGHLESVRVLVEGGAKVNDSDSSVLLTAINNGHSDIATFLLDSGADPNVPDRGGYTALHRAVLKRSRVEQASIYEGMLVVVKALVAHGADQNVRILKPPPPPPDAQPSARFAIDTLDLNGVTPFWLAASGIDIPVMRVLVAGGADPRLPSADNTTPLMVAAGLGQAFRGKGTARRGDSAVQVIEALKLLLEWGNDINVGNDYHQTALHGAADGVSATAVKFLVDHGARIDRTDSVGRTPLVVADDHRTDKYRSNQNLNPVDIERTWALLRRLSGEPL